MLAAAEAGRLRGPLYKANGNTRVVECKIEVAKNRRRVASFPGLPRLPVRLRDVIVANADS